MKRFSHLITALLLCLSAVQVSAAEIYMVMERGSVLFRLDTNRWESAPNYLKLREGDRLRALPGTIARVYHSCGAEFQLPVGGTVTIEDRGISQLMGDDKVIIRWEDGLYHSRVVPARAADLPPLDEPRVIDTWPSRQYRQQKMEVIDELGDALRARLNSARGTVLTQEMPRWQDRLSPFDSELPGVRPAPLAFRAFERKQAEAAGHLERERVATDKLRYRRLLESDLRDADALKRAINLVKQAGNSALAEEKALRNMHDRIRERRFRLSRLQEREFLLMNR